MLMVTAQFGDSNIMPVILLIVTQKNRKSKIGKKNRHTERGERERERERERELSLIHI